MGGGVNALAVSGTSLYAGGWFATAGRVPANYIAKWDGSAWSALGSGMALPLGIGGMVRALAADSAGQLFVGGGFSMAGSKFSPFIAQAYRGSAPIILMPPQSQTAEIGSTVNFTPDSAGGPLMTYLLFCNGTNLISCGYDRWLKLANVDLSHSGTYTVVVTNLFGAATSSPAMLNVIPPVERKSVPGINLIGEAGSSLNVEYTDTLGPTGNWLPLDKVALASTSQFCFDVSIPLPPQRFYRAWQSGTPGVLPSLNLPFFVPAITVTGSIGNSVRVDGINQFGPTDAWFTLDTVTLTNTSQLYFDVSVISQPPRLYRLVQVP